ncbi:hypothetical protein ACV07N_10695 [Roseivirga echinicomitans]
MSNQEKKDKKFSMIMSVVVHGTLLTLLLFLVAWRQPNPPIPEYGIELNFGFEEAGSGDIERENKAEIEETENDTPPESEQETEEVVEEPEEETPVVEAVKEVTPPKQEVVKEVVKETPKEEIKAEVVQQKESEVKAEEKKVEEVVVKKEEVKPPAEVKKEVTKPVEEKKEVVKPVPVVDQRAIMGGGKKAESESKEAASNNQGKELDKRGNMGDPTGKTTANGTLPGGADLGVSLSLDGWKWASPPTEKDDSQIEGVIKFRIEVDDRGTVINVTKIPGTTISDNTIIEFYKKQVEKLTFKQTDPSKMAANISKGEITFVIKTN